MPENIRLINTKQYILDVLYTFPDVYLFGSVLELFKNGRIEFKEGDLDYKNSLHSSPQDLDFMINPLLSKSQKDNIHNKFLIFSESRGVEWSNYNSDFYPGANVTSGYHPKIDLDIDIIYTTQENYFTDSLFQRFGINLFGVFDIWTGISSTEIFIKTLSERIIEIESNINFYRFIKLLKKGWKLKTFVAGKSIFFVEKTGIKCDNCDRKNNGFEINVKDSGDVKKETFIFSCFSSDCISANSQQLDFCCMIISERMIFTFCSPKYGIPSPLLLSDNLEIDDDMDSISDIDFDEDILKDELDFYISEDVSRIASPQV